MSLFSAKELSKYSVTKALSEIARGAPGQLGEVTGLEREVSDTLKSHIKRVTGTMPDNFLLPIASLKSLNVTTATAGGFLVSQDLAGIVPRARIPPSPR